MQDWPEALGVRCTAQQGASRFLAGEARNSTDIRTVRIAVQAIIVLASAAGASGIAVASSVSAAPTGQSTSTCSASGLASHLVADGDSWSVIARAAQVSLRSLFEVNDASAERALYPGDVVCLPAGATLSSSCSPSNASTYAVEPGDTWWEIATRAGVTMSKLLTTNAASDTRVIHPGDTVCLPPGSSVSSSNGSSSRSSTVNAPSSMAPSPAARGISRASVPVTPGG